MRRRTSASVDMLYLTLFLALLPFTAQGLAVPVISLNSTRVRDPVLTLTSGTSFSLSCEGHEAVFWKTRHSQHKKHVSKNTLTIRHATPDDTGTYRCSYRNHSQLYSETHIYVKDPGRPFTTPQSTVVVEREGSDCLLDCLPTDPKATVFSLCLANRSAVHPEMKYTANPKEGIWIRDLRPYYSGDYVCTVILNSRQRVSAVFQITVIKRVKHPPSVFTEVEELVRIVGEKLQVICYIANPDHSYHITWEDSSKKKLHAEHKVNRSSNSVLITSVLTLPEVRLSDSGNLSCIGNNSAGENRSVVSLRVVDKAYVQLLPLQSSRVPQQSVRVELHKGDLLELHVLVDAHPPVQQSWWDTPRPQNGSTYRETLHRVHKSSRYIATLSLNRIRADENGWYTFNVRSRSVNSSIRFEVHVFQKPSVVVEWKNSTFTCVASGYPQPRVQWWRCADLHVTGDRCNTNSSHLVELLSRQNMVKPLEKFKPQQVESILDWNVIPRNTTIQCVAVNSVGEAHQAVFTGGSITLPEHWFSRIYKAVFTGSTVIITVLILLLGVCIYKWKQKPRYEVRWKIIEVNDGNNYTYIDPTQLPYNTKWEFPRDRLTFGQVLGAGAFGKVVEATALGLDNDEGVTRVAVKMLKSSAHSEEREALMSELKILNHLGSHNNIVNLLGACTQGGPVLLITEYCCHGDLLSFLRRRAPLFLSSVVLDLGCSQLYKNLPVQEREQGVSSYEDMQSAHRLMNGVQGSCNGDQKSLDLDCLLRFAGQVAQGMDFLASKKCIHRDLAARNVLVTDCFVAKICDFGLARDIKNDSNYVVRGNARLPVKWMSPESIFECIYTVQSDVWSYGILLWEIFSLGGSPYPDVVVDARFYEMIKLGYHMPQPDFAPTEMYSIMKQCWNLQPTLRPPFSKVLRLISNLLPELQNSIADQQYKNLHQELQQKIMSKQCTSAQEPEEPEEPEQPSNRAPCREAQRLLPQQEYHQPC